MKRRKFKTRHHYSIYSVKNKGRYTLREGKIQANEKKTRKPNVTSL